MNIQTGMIIIWHGSVASIPAGWLLCDGTNGTPDLRGLFVMGAGDSYDPGDTGGAATHTHTFTSNTHSHGLSGEAILAAGTEAEHILSQATVTGTTNAGSSLPPYYALAYIMKS